MGFRNYIQQAIESTVYYGSNVNRTRINPLSATGGTIYTPGDGYKYHVFTSPGTFEVVSFGSFYGFNFDYVAIGGGGGGGSANDAGGGGAGGYITSTITLNSTGSFPITVGAGGPAGISGNDTIISFPSPVTAGLGGAGGASPPLIGVSVPLGSGGGGANPLGASGTGGPQGNPGGTGGDDGGGGGGAGGAGAPAVTAHGGIGVQLAAPYRNIPGIGFPGPPTGPGGYWFAGGGGGGYDTAPKGGGGGPGGPYAGAGNGGAGTSGASASANSGSGGGGSGLTPTIGGSGGSGIVIIRYLL